MDALYVKYGMLATGGAIGDVLFLFASGYTLLLSKRDLSFDNWYMAGSAPMPNISSEYSVWDSGNPGSAKYGIIPTKS